MKAILLSQKKIEMPQFRNPEKYEKGGGAWLSDVNTEKANLMMWVQRSCYHYRMKSIYMILILSVQTFTSKLLNIIDYEFAESEESQLLVWLSFNCISPLGSLLANKLMKIGL